MKILTGWKERERKKREVAVENILDSGLSKSCHPSSSEKKGERKERFQCEEFKLQARTRELAMANDRAQGKLRFTRSQLKVKIK